MSKRPTAAGPGAGANNNATTATRSPPATAGLEFGDIKIETDVPMPAQVRSSKLDALPFSKMDVGASFAVPAPGDEKAAQAIRSALTRAAKKQGVVVSTRSVTEDGTPRIRVWRLADGTRKPRVPKAA